MNSKRDFSLKQSTDGKTSLVVVGLFLIDSLKIASTLSDFHCLMKAGKVGRNVGESKKKLHCILFCSSFVALSGTSNKKCILKNYSQSLD